MLEELRAQLRGAYPQGCADELVSMEKELLYYDAFGSKESLELGSEVVRQSQKYGEGIVILVIRLADGAVIFQYIGDDRGARNISFAMAKYNTVLKTGHCSLWALAQEETVGRLDEVFDERSGCLPVGGAFPVFEAGKMVAVITTSGMHNGNDFRAVADAFCALKKKPRPEFNGKIV